jgi:EamA domain-containing membrane protein RarD
LANKSSFGRKKALIESVLAGTFFGTAAIFIRLLEDIDVFSIAFWR